MSTRGHEQLTADVLASFEGADPRLKEVLTCAVTHLHAFVEEAQVTQSEWMRAIEFLTEAGQTCTPERQEMVLLSDVLGVSSQVELNAARDEAATAGTVLGPFYVPDSPWRDVGASILDSPDPGPRVTVSGQVRDSTGRPVPGATLDVWQTASNRLYAVQDQTQAPTNLRARFLAGDDGRFAFETVRPVPYSIPDDGPVGRLLEMTGRHPWRPAHIHFLVTADGYAPLATHVFDAGSPYVGSDAVFSVEDSLVIEFTRSSTGSGLCASFDITLSPTVSLEAAL
jgi:protocatechuate 3,4-dioxygenase beta subunit